MYLTMTRLFTLLLALLSLVSPDLHAGGPIALSGDMALVEKQLTAKDTDSPVVLVIDRPALSHGDAARLLAALESCRKSKKSVIAVCPKLAKPAAGGSALVALSCDAIAFVEGAALAGAEAGWCLNPDTIKLMKTKCSKLGGIDPLLAERLAAATSNLYWSGGNGFTTEKTTVQLAKAGVAMAVDAEMLRSVGIDAEVYPSLDEVIAAAGDGRIESRNPDARSTAKGAAPGAKSPPKPAAKPAASPQDPAEIEKRLQPKLKEYNEALAELQSLQKRFYLYWTGNDGVWTTQHKSLREIWRTESDHTAHADTRTTCQRLQRDMKAAITTLRTTASDIIRIAKDPANPAVVRVNSHKEPLEEFRDALQRNKVDLYEKWYPAIEKLK